jgi:hypothetical protein
MKGIGVNLMSLVLLGCYFFTIPCTHADTVYLSTFNDNTIDKYNSSGAGSDFATAESGLNYPTGLAFVNGNLYVANAGNNTIQEFTTNGVGSVLTNLQSGEAFALASDSSGDLYISNVGNNTIYKYSANGNWSTLPFGGIAMACDSNGNLFINPGNNTIDEVNSNGTESVFVTNGLSNPQGLAFDGNGNLYVADEGDRTIEIFNASGQPSTFTSTNLLNEPIGLAFDGNGNLFVANYGDGDILEFNSNGVGHVFAYGLEGAANYIAIEVPEPSSLLLLGLGFSLLALVRHRLPASGRLGHGGFRRHQAC